MAAPSVLGTEMQDMLRCIRCGACMNHCPVYGAIGGHAYGWVYPGPIGAVLTPQLIGVEEAGNLPNASTFCGRCESVCPVRIPLPKLMRHWREREFERHLTPRAVRQGLALWSFLARRPKLYRRLTGWANRVLALFGRGEGRYRTLPLASGWTRFRDFPAPQPGGTFHAQWARHGEREPGHERDRRARADPERHPPLAPSRRAGRRRARPSRRGSPRRRAARRSPAPTSRSRKRSRCSANGRRPTTPPSRAWRRPRWRREVAAYLARNNLPAEAAMAPSPLLDGYDWASQKMLALRRGRGEGSDQVSITGAFAGIAETGTAGHGVGARPSGVAEPPARHPCRGAARGRHRRRLRGCVGAAARALRQGPMPRTVNTITGPSRTGDIEQAMELGAHGPRRMHIVVVRE